MRPAVVLLVTIVVSAAASAQNRSPTAGLEPAMLAFLDAKDPADASRATRRIIETRARVEDVLARLRNGRAYGKAPTGRVAMPSRDRGLPLDNVVEIPADYDPARRWPVRVSLHGGVGRGAPEPGDPPARPLTNRIPGAGEIVIHPRAWSSSEWWTRGQIDNIGRLLDRVKRQYNIDESRVYVTGISDGGTGVYYLGMREATPWAACLPLNGHPLVLATPDVGADGQLYPGNLANCPLYIVNGGRDRLYPAASVSPYVDMFRRAGAKVVFQVHPEAGHDVSWWPEERPRYAAFLAAHLREAHPPSISWETERTDRYNRFRWIIIDRLGRRGSDVRLEDVNRVAQTPDREVALFERSKPSGRVDATRRGNVFDLQTRGVQELTLLLSPDVIDFARPVHVIVNGRPVHEAIIRQDAGTLLAWAARDNDRTMLYTAALTVVVP